MWQFSMTRNNGGTCYKYTSVTMGTRFWQRSMGTLLSPSRHEAPLLWFDQLRMSFDPRGTLWQGPAGFNSYGAGYSGGYGAGFGNPGQGGGLGGPSVGGYGGHPRESVSASNPGQRPGGINGRGDAWGGQVKTALHRCLYQANRTMYVFQSLCSA